MQMVSAKVPMLCEQIWNGHKQVQLSAYYLEYLCLHMKEERLIPALEWLIAREIVGQKFIDFIFNDCKSSGLEFLRQLTMRIERDKETRAILRKDIA